MLILGNPKKGSCAYEVVTVTVGYLVGSSASASSPYVVAAAAVICLTECFRVNARGMAHSSGTSEEETFSVTAEGV